MYDYGSATSTVDAASAGVFGAFMLVFLIIIIIALVLSVLVIIGQWRIFKKANQPGWAALIPIYNTFCMCKVTGVNTWWVLISLLAPVVLGLIPVVGSLLGTVVSLYFAVILYVSLARSFGKSDGYAALLIFLAPIFFLVLGRNQEQYLGPKPMHDIVFDDWFKQNQNANANMQNQNANVNMQNQNANANEQTTIENNNQQDRFCPDCGAKIEGNSSFCSNCGKQI